MNIQATEFLKVYEELAQLSIESLTEDTDAIIDKNYMWEYTYIFNSSRFNEEQFKEKIIITLRRLKNISAVQAIPEAAEILVAGLKEGSEIKGYANFELGDTTLTVKAKKVQRPTESEAAK